MLTLASLVLLVSPQAALAQDLRLPAVLGDHAVLQRGATVRVFGHAHPRAEVRASASWGHEASSRADDGGAFELRLQPAEQAGPHALTVSAGAGTRTLRDLWFGDVWLCGGQSNMEDRKSTRLNSSHSQISYA